MASTSRLFVLYFVMMVFVVQVYVEAAEIGASTASGVYVEAAEIRASTAAGLQTNGMKNRLLQTIDCNAACGERCKKASRHKVCLRACGTCCAKCNCVPPGTSGNQDLCPCYANLKTHGNKPKCP